MGDEIVRETVCVMFHLNGYTKVLVERTKGVGLADGGIVWEIPTEIIPFHLRPIGSRFIVQHIPLSSEEMEDVEAIHAGKSRIEIFELS
jgi:hypothetical protein